MKYLLPIILTAPMLYPLTTTAAEQDEIKVLSLNVWQEGTMIKNGYQAIIDRIVDINPDIITLQEVRNYKDDFQKRLAADLQKRGLTYNVASTYAKYGKEKSAGIGKKGTDDTGILTKYKIIADDSAEKSTRALIDINGQTAAVYSVHLDYLSLAQYEPRGYSGDSYRALPNAITDEKQVLADNARSKRPQQISAVLEDAKALRQKGDVVIIAGDFNEPSYLDWTEKNRNQYGHNGAVIHWTSSKRVADAGYLDTFRTRNPDEQLHPGFTWLANNTEKLHPDIKDPGIDERDRIDFIYIDNSGKLEVVDSKTYGPAGEVVGGARDTAEIESQKIALPANKVWPSDHLGLLTTLRLKDK